MGMGVKRNISLGEMEPVFVMASTQGVIVKKFFIVSYSIKNCIPRRDLGQMRGLQKKNLRDGDEELGTMGGFTVIRGI